ncbi:MAG: hypothetical protein ABJC55_13535, partial [Algoriphagus sp.]
FAGGILFLVLYWSFGYDGITFSDDVYYLLAGKNFWEGSMEVNDYHFSSRWGAYVPSGLIGHLLGFEPHRISLISLLSYGLSLLFLMKILPKSAPAWMLTVWFCTQVYFLHFLTKVYPDSSLVLWTCLVPVAATFRKSSPILSAFILVLSLFVGFLTKETIVLLAPFPILLFYFDWKRKDLKPSFYLSLVATAIVLSALYLSYFWVKFGDPLHRITSINAGHYISEYTYADKGLWSILRRLTILPVITLVERSYWAWIVFAIPGIALGLKSKRSPAYEFALAILCLIIGFWFMTSTLEFYNPIYLNPRHLIILVPILSMLIALGTKEWINSKNWKNYLTLLLLVGVGVSLTQLDLKMAGFNLALVLGIQLANLKSFPLYLSLTLTAPAILAIPYQQNLKQFDNLISNLEKITQSTDFKIPIYTHSFLTFSKEILIPDDSIAQSSLFSLYQFPENPPEFPQRLKVLIYDYYLHAYPEEQEDLDDISSWLHYNYVLQDSCRQGNITVKTYERISTK